MGWNIALISNTVKISRACAEDLFNAQNEASCGELWGDSDDVVYKNKLSFDPDHMEHMDYLQDDVFQDVLKKHKVKGDVCFGSLEGDNAGSFWGYRFDGKGGMTSLDGRIVWNPMGSEASVEQVPDDAEPDAASQGLAGKTIVFTGTLSRSRQEFADIAARAGATVSGSVSAKTDFLVAGQKPGSKLTQAEKRNVAVLDEAAFMSLARRR